MVLDPYISFGEASTPGYNILIDEFRVWSTYLGTAFPATAYSSGTYPATAPDVYYDWSLDGTTYHDRSGNNRDLVNPTTITWSSLINVPVARALLTVPYIRAQAGFTATFSGGTSTYYPSGNTMTSGTASVVTLNPGMNYFHILNSVCGTYGFQIIRQGQDVSNIAVRCNDLLGVRNYPVNIGWALLTSSFSATVYQEMDLCSVAVTYATTNTVTYSYANTAMSGAVGATSTSWSPNLFPLSFGNNVIKVFSSLDGQCEAVAMRERDSSCC